MVIFDKSNCDLSAQILRNTCLEPLLSILFSFHFPSNKKSREKSSLPLPQLKKTPSFDSGRSSSFNLKSNISFIFLSGIEPTKLNDCPQYKSYLSQMVFTISSIINL